MGGRGSKHPARRALLLALGLPLAAPAQGGAHQHGVGTLDIAVEARRIVVQFDTPLDNLLGFERAPRTDAERRRVDQAINRLKDGDRLQVQLVLPRAQAKRQLERPDGRLRLAP